MVVVPVLSAQNTCCMVCVLYKYVFKLYSFLCYICVTLLYCLFLCFPTFFRCSCKIPVWGRYIKIKSPKVPVWGFVLLVHF